MTTKRETIVQAVMARLASLPGVTGVYRSREEAMTREESPCISVRWLNDTPLREIPPHVDKRLALEVYVYARGATADAVADPVVEAVHGALLGEPSLGGLLIDLSADSTKLDLEEADLTAAGVAMRFLAHYRHARVSLAG